MATPRNRARLGRRLFGRGWRQASTRPRRQALPRPSALLSRGSRPQALRRSASATGSLVRDLSLGLVVCDGLASSAESRDASAAGTSSSGWAPPSGAVRRDVVERLAVDTLERQREPPPVGVDLDDPHLDLVALRDDLARVLDVVLCEFGDVDEPLDAREDLDEGAERDDLRHRAFDDVALLVLLEHVLPRVALGLLETERDPLALAVDVEHLHVDRLADLEHLGRMVDVGPRKLGDVDEAVHPVEVDEGAEVDDVGDRPSTLSPGLSWSRIRCRCSLRSSSSTARRERTTLLRWRLSSMTLH